jgi:glutathione S-transferase
MKLYAFPPAPNPRRLNTDLGEKQIEIPVQLVNLTTSEHKQPEMLAKNPMAGLPFLELDDGTILTESLAIMKYLEELHPKPLMVGRTPVERALTRRRGIWSSSVESQITPSSPRPTQSISGGTCRGGHAIKASAVAASTSIGGPTTGLVRTRCARS